LVQPTGKKAYDAHQLLALVREVKPGVIYHHTHQYYLKAAIENPEYPNDFAVWAAECLEERALAEKLASMDMFSYSHIEDVRRALINIIASHLKEHLPPRSVQSEDAFFFNNAVTVVIETGLEADSLVSFVEALNELGTSSIYFHFFEARLRLHRPTDDFSLWLETSLGKTEVANRIRKIDPYQFSLEGLRREIILRVQS
jgi:hypothetical protein